MLCWAKLLSVLRFSKFVLQNESARPRDFGKIIGKDGKIFLSENFKKNAHCRPGFAT